MNIEIVPIGGRIKSAAVGLDHLYAFQDPVELHRHLSELRRKPPFELLQAFFPGDTARLRQMMRGVGFYRPTLKTDQGMAGNFLGFRIDPDLEVTDLSPRRIVREEGIAIPESWCNHDREQVRRVREAFREFQLHECARLLEGMPARTAEKGVKGTSVCFFRRIFVSVFLS